MKSNNENNLVEIFAGSSIEAEMVKSLLLNAEIQAFLKDGTMGTIAPWYVSPGGAGAVKVIISETDSEKAKSIVEDFYNSINSEE